MRMRDIGIFLRNVNHGNRILQASGLKNHFVITAVKQKLVMKGCVREGQQNFRILLLKKHQNKIKKLPDDFAVTQRERDHRDPPIRQSPPPQPFPCFAPPLPFSLSN